MLKNENNRGRETEPKVTRPILSYAIFNGQPMCANNSFEIVKPYCPDVLENPNSFIEMGFVNAVNILLRQDGSRTTSFNVLINPI